MTELDAEQKRELREHFVHGFDNVVNAVHEHYTIDEAPYLQEMRDGSTHYYKSWKLWNKDDLVGKIDGRLIKILDDIVKADDFEHLHKILPDAYNGNVKQFADDIHSAAVERHLLNVSSYKQPASDKAISTEMADIFEQLKQKAGKLADVIHQPNSDVVPVAFKSTAAKSLAA